MNIDAFIPKRGEIVYHIKSIRHPTEDPTEDPTKGLKWESGLKWKSDNGLKSENYFFNLLLDSSILELQLAEPHYQRQRPENNISSDLEYVTFRYNPHYNNAKLSIKPRANSKGGRHRHRATFRQRRLKRRATRRTRRRV
jgi:hypothetical protein